MNEFADVRGDFWMPAADQAAVLKMWITGEPAKTFVLQRLTERIDAGATGLNGEDIAASTPGYMKELVMQCCREAIEKIDETGEDLRRELLNALNGSDREACPRCGTETSLAKAWKMAGRPSKTGERLQLTIGYYKCSKCNKPFRRVLAKEKIKA